MDHIRTCGNEIRNWPVGARRDLIYSDNIDVVKDKDDDNIIGRTLKFTLMVVYPVFRQHFEFNSDAKRVKVSDANIEDATVTILLRWVKTIISKPIAKFGVKVSGTTTHLVILHYAVHKPGMDQYIRQFIPAYMKDLHILILSTDECKLLQRLSVNFNDELNVSICERLAYLRRVAHFNPRSTAALTAFINDNPLICTGRWRRGYPGYAVQASRVDFHPYLKPAPVPSQLMHIEFKNSLLLILRLFDQKQYLLSLNSISWDSVFT
jgi:hypothetical protein